MSHFATARRQKASCAIRIPLIADGCCPFQFSLADRRFIRHSARIHINRFCIFASRNTHLVSVMLPDYKLVRLVLKRADQDLTNVSRNAARCPTLAIGEPVSLSGTETLGESEFSIQRCIRAAAKRSPTAR